MAEAIEEAATSGDGKTAFTLEDISAQIQASEVKGCGSCSRRMCRDRWERFVTRSSG